MLLTGLTGLTGNIPTIATAIPNVQLQNQFHQQQQIQMQKQQQLRAIMAARSQATQNRIYIGSLPFEVGEVDVRAAFSPYGTIKEVIMCPVCCCFLL